MKILIAIPTLNRLEKLTNCINSIVKSKRDNDIILSLCFDYENELEYFKNLFKDINWIYYYKITNYRAPHFWNSILKEMPPEIDALVYLNDDVLLHDNTLDELFKTYQEYFSDFDGVMGIRQANLPIEATLPSAFGVIGKKYANRFPNKKVWCEEYYRFYADEELLLHAKSLNKFHFAENVKIDHLHPSFDNNQMDETHHSVRKYKKLDIDIYNKRKKILEYE